MSRVLSMLHIPPLTYLTRKICSTTAWIIIEKIKTFGKSGFWKITLLHGRQCSICRLVEIRKHNKNNVQASTVFMLLWFGIITPPVPLVRI